MVDRSDAVDRRAKAFRKLALGELRTATRFVPTDFLALDFARVAGHETGFAQRRTQRLVISHQRAGDAETDRAGLAGDSAALDV